MPDDTGLNEPETREPISVPVVLCAALCAIVSLVVLIGTDVVSLRVGAFIGICAALVIGFALGAFLVSRAR